MMHRMLRFSPHWEWHELHEERPEAAGLLSRRNKQKQHLPSSIQVEIPIENVDMIHRLKQENPELAAWLGEQKSGSQNYVTASELPSGEPLLYGTLIFQASENNHDLLPLHFWLTPSRLATVHTDYRLSIKLQMEPWEEKVRRCDTAPEAFFVILSLILEHFHIGLDAFEARLGKLEHKMQRSNRTNLMNMIFDRRYELLHWSHLFVPIREIMGASKEAFLDLVSEQEEYKRLEFKLERLHTLFTHYAMEMDTLLMMDDAIAAFRGNDIMKTLTIFTALLTPAAVVGTIWGMNFEHIPGASKPWGFLAISLLIVISTLMLYVWLWRKGWTSELSRGRKPQDILTASTLSEHAWSESATELPPRGSRSTAAKNLEQETAKSSPSRSRSKR